MKNKYVKGIICIILALSMAAGLLTGCTNKPGKPSGDKDIEDIGFEEDDPNEPDVCIKKLTVDYTSNPLGVDNDSPVFGWIMKDGRIGAGQVAYEIKIAKSACELDTESAWTTGKVESSLSNAIKLDNMPELAAQTRYYWTVKVWNDIGEELNPVKPAYFETGLKDDGFEGSEWISASPIGSSSSSSANIDLNSANWIWLLNGRDHANLPEETCYFRGKADLDGSKKVKSAYIAMTADDNCEVYLNGETIGFISNVTDAWKSGKVIDVTEIIKTSNIIAAKVNNTGTYAGFILKLKVTYEDGKTANFVTDSSWKCSLKEDKNFYKPEFNDSSWKKPDQKSSYGTDAWASNVVLGAPQKPTALEGGAPMLRKTFSAKGEISNARLFATAAGIYLAEINGKQVGNDWLNPGRTEYQKHTMYQTFDVTELLKEGDNAIGFTLGNGWYIGAQAGYGHTIPAVLAKLVITYKDGTVEEINTDSTWKTTLEGPILYDDLFNGEHYDAGREIKGWSEPTFDDGRWTGAYTTTSKALGIGEIITQLSGTIKNMSKVKGVTVTKIKGDKYIIDFGQNLSGVVEFTLQGKAGQKITIRHAEILNDASGTGDGPEGTLYTLNLRTAEATDSYIFGEDGKVTWHPNFTFHGFRYIEVSGLDYKPNPEDFTALAIYSSMETTISFDTSNDLINQLFSNAYWGQRSNFISTPTDCPQRDERMGWSGDAQIFCLTATYNMNSVQFYQKYIMDMNDCQAPSGSYPDTAPQNAREWYMGTGHGAWGDAGIIIPYVLYKQYGDTETMAKYYKNMSKYINYLVKDAGSDYIRDTQNVYGDWLSIGESTPVPVMDTAYCRYVTMIMSEMASILGHDEDAKKFAEQSEKFRAAWCDKYLRANGQTKANTQTSYIVGLYFDIIPENLKAAAAQNLVKRIEKNGNKLATGFLGVSYLLPVLCDNGYADVAYGLLLQEEYPSWIYPILQGATTIWERWNSYTKTNGFGDAGMNSFNHYSYGSVMAWCYSYMLGISSADGTSFREIILKPVKSETFTYAKGSYNSVYGLIESGWEIKDGKFIYTCTIPANTTATIYIPAEAGTEVDVNGAAAKEAEGIEFLRAEDGYMIFAAKAGTYKFTV